METNEIFRIGVLTTNKESLASTLIIKELAEADINSFCEKANIQIRFEFNVTHCYGSRAKALEKVQSFYAMGINLIVGPSWSSHCQACLDYANANGIILFSGTSTSPLLSIPSDNLFRLCPDDTVQAPAISKMIQSSGINSLIVIRRGDAWADSIFNYFKTIWEKIGNELWDIRYDSEDYVYDKYLVKAEEAAHRQLDIFGLNKMAVLILSFSEFTELIKGVEKYPILNSLTWYGSDSTALFQDVIQNAPEQVQKLKIYSTLAAPVESVKFNEIYDRYYKLSKKPLGYYYACVYDICWIYALAVLSCRTTDAAIISKIIPNIAKNYFGASGWCQLNEFGDRRSSNYQIWGYGQGNQGLGSYVYGLYDALTDSVNWVEPIIPKNRRRFNPIDTSILIYERMNTIEKDVRKIYIDTQIIKKQTKPQSFIQRILDWTLENIMGIIIGVVLAYLFGILIQIVL